MVNSESLTNPDIHFGANKNIFIYQGEEYLLSIGASHSCTIDNPIQRFANGNNIIILKPRSVMTPTDKEIVNGEL